MGEKLDAFNAALVVCWKEDIQSYDSMTVKARRSRDLAILIGAPPDIKARWWRLPLRVDLELTDDQLHLCKLLAGPHGLTIKRMLEMQLEASGGQDGLP